MLMRNFNFKKAVLFGLLCAGGLCLYQLSYAENEKEVAARSAPDVPKYDEQGALEFPETFRRWIFVGAALGLSYSEHAPHPDEQQFTNVYITPAAYQHYELTGSFPEKTMLAMAVYRRQRKPPLGDLKLHGSYEGELVAVEVAVKDGDQFHDGWAYFDFSPEKGETKLRRTATAFPTKKCYDCHLEHAADDNVFVQFYPVLRRLMDNKPVK